MIEDIKESGGSDSGQKGANAASAELSEQPGAQDAREAQENGPGEQAVFAGAGTQNPADSEAPAGQAVFVGTGTQSQADPKTPEAQAVSAGAGTQNSADSEAPAGQAVPVGTDTQTVLENVEGGFVSEDEESRAGKQDVSAGVTEQIQEVIGNAADTRVQEDAAERKAEDAPGKKKKRSELFVWIKDILIAVLIAVIIAQFIQPTVVREHSMQNTLQPNDYLILSKMAYKFGEIEYGDIVVFKSDLVDETTGKKKLLIKRVIAKGGDTISIADGNVYRNGEMLDEPYIKDGYTNGGIDEMVIPDGELFLMGDNRVNSRDSRDASIGCVSEDLVVGKATIRLFPFSEIGSIYD